MLFWLRSRVPQGRIDMSLDDLLREIIATGKLQEPFTASDAARVLSQNDWPLPRIQSFLVRHCMGNLAATTLIVERVSFGKYKLIYDGPREPVDSAGPVYGQTNGPFRREPPISPGDPES
jgi:hypothetical protein